MAATTQRELVDTLRKTSRVLSGAADDYDLILDRVRERDVRFVLIGEASHGTHEFYTERAEITKRLIREQGFSAVAVEADWPDAARANRYVMDRGQDGNAFDALSDFIRFPTWMWRNTVVVNFIDWLRAYNEKLPQDTPDAGFYGLDLYSLHASMDAVLRYLEKIDPQVATRVREQYACFDHFGQDVRSYGMIASAGVADWCQEEVVGVLVELQRRATEFAQRDGRVAQDAFFDAEQNARLVRNAEAYYRAMFLAEESSWNLRDRHMAETLDALAAHLERRDKRPAKIVVWAHNSHLGDARATEMTRRGELNLGQLVRERHGDRALLIGFSTDHGTVTAASNWDAPAERKRVRPALSGSYESLFHQTEIPRFLLPSNILTTPRLERAIGVIYRPKTERQSHYFNARLSDQFDLVLHFDETRAVEPLERTAGWDRGEAPETFPFGV
jgi:erythromycin esterase-like protein